MIKTIAVAATLLFAGSAYADEVIIQRVVPVVPPSTTTTTIEKHGADCDSKSVRKENDLGESKTVTRTDCD